MASMTDANMSNVLSIVYSSHSFHEVECCSSFNTPHTLCNCHEENYSPLHVPTKQLQATLSSDEKSRPPTALRTPSTFIRTKKDPREK